jgi:capsular exopolysaccharide synthesis family protein
VTSALPGEGKSTVAANLARTLAMGGSKVLLVDGDLRRGVLHELVGLQREPGLADLLRQPGDLDRVVQTNCQPNFSFIAAGTHLPNPGDALLRAPLDRLMAQWREQFDFIVFDSSPVLAADDAANLAPKVDGTLFVVRNRRSRSRQVREALDLLCQRQARILGIIYNGADTSSGSYYYYKNAEYYNTGTKTAEKISV